MCDKNSIRMSDPSARGTQVRLACIPFGQIPAKRTGAAGADPGPRAAHRLGSATAGGHTQREGESALMDAAAGGAGGGRVSGGPANGPTSGPVSSPAARPAGGTVRSGRRPTLEQVAKVAGVSRATVSRVVNQVESVDPDIRGVVERAIAETGYGPTRLARAPAGAAAGRSAGQPRLCGSVLRTDRGRGPGRAGAAPDAPDAHPRGLGGGADRAAGPPGAAGPGWGGPGLGGAG